MGKSDYTNSPLPLPLNTARRRTTTTNHPPGVGPTKPAPMAKTDDCDVVDAVVAVGIVGMLFDFF